MTQEQKHSKRKRCCEGDLVAWVSPLPGQAQAPAQVRSWQGPLHLLRVLLAQQASCAEPAAPLRESQALQERCKAGATDFEQPFLSSTLGCIQCPDTVYTLIGTTPPQVLSLRCFVRGTDSPVWKDCLPVLSPSSTGNNKCWLLLLRLGSISCLADACTVVRCALMQPMGGIAYCCSLADSRGTPWTCLLLLCILDS